MSCPCCGTTLAEFMLNLADRINHPRSALVMCQGANEKDLAENLAKAKLALDFAKVSSVIKFRAIAEDWTQERIIRELY